MKHNWPQLLKELRAAGMTRYKISLALGIRVNQLALIENGSEPKYTVGVTIITLHEAKVSHGTTIPCS